MKYFGKPSYNRSEIANNLTYHSFTWRTMDLLLFTAKKYIPFGFIILTFQNFASFITVYYLFGHGSESKSEFSKNSGNYIFFEMYDKLCYNSRTIEKTLTMKGTLEVDR